MHTINQTKRKSGFSNEFPGTRNERTGNKILLITGFLLLILPFAGYTDIMAQVGGLTNTGNMTVCLNATESYGVIPTNGSTFAWDIIAGSGGNGTINIGPAPHNLISVTWNSPGTCNLRVIETNSAGCAGPDISIQITVNSLNTASLTSALGTDHQTLCEGNAITNITYSTTGVTGATVTGLPAGVEGNFTANVVTISGTPATPGTYTYQVILSASCGASTTTGTITVNPILTPTITSSVSPVCLGTAGVVYTTEPGMSNYVWGVSGGIITSGGTPTDNTVTITWNGTGPYSVTVNYSRAGGCSSGTPATQIVNVTQPPVTSPIYHN
jgi:hypothetical protein